MSDEKVIMFDSPEAAQFKPVEGWVDSHGFFFGADERTARYSGSTHTKCETCSEIHLTYFRINPDNFSGRRLYRICGDHRLLVTNSCRECQSTASDHGKPDHEWVVANLTFLKSEKMDLLLVCGRVAKETYELSGFQFPKVIFMDHPAARRWSNASLDAMTVKVAEMLA